MNKEKKDRKIYPGQNEEPPLTETEDYLLINSEAMRKHRWLLYKITKRKQTFGLYFHALIISNSKIQIEFIVGVLFRYDWIIF